MMLRTPMTSVFHNEEETQIRRSFSAISCTSWRVLRAQDGLLPCGLNNRFLASTRFARPNRLNNCAVFLAKPL